MRVNYLIGSASHKVREVIVIENGTEADPFEFSDKTKSKRDCLLCGIIPHQVIGDRPRFSQNRWARL